MNIKLQEIIDNGKHSDERIVLKAVTNVNLANYMLLDATYLPDGKLSNKARHVHWFKSKIVNANDTIVLYTKKGQPSEQKNANGTTSHFLHWGLDSSVWNNTGDRATLIEIKETESLTI